MISFIGDVHGKVDRYEKIARKAPHTVQVGDFGFHKEWAWLDKSGLDPALHKVLCGNHDVPPPLNTSKFSLGNYGMASVGGTNFFFIRGAHSIDSSYRVEGVSWWREEQLNQIDLANAIDEFERIKPDVVVSHEAPAYLKRMLCGEANDRTSQALDQMWVAHRPKVWVHGHHHKSQRMTILGTHFVSLAELEVFRL